MDTLDEKRLQQLLQNFEGPQGIATLNPLAFQYPDQLYFPGQIPQLMEEPDIAPEYGLNLIGNDLPYLKELTPTTDMGATGTIPQLPANRLQGLDFSRFQSLPANMGVANEADEDQEFLPDQEPSGIAKLFELLGKIPTPFNLARRGLESLKGFNQRLRQSDFGQAKNLSDYFDMRSYGGLREREKQRAETMAQARGIQKGIDRGDFDGPNRGDRDRGSVTEKSAAKSKGVGGGGYTKSDDNRESYRG